MGVAPSQPAPLPPFEKELQAEGCGKNQHRHQAPSRQPRVSKLTVERAVIQQWERQTQHSPAQQQQQPLQHIPLQKDQSQDTRTPLAIGSVELTHVQVKGLEGGGRVVLDKTKHTHHPTKIDKA